MDRLSELRKFVTEEICNETLKKLSGGFTRRDFKRKFVESILKAKKRTRTVFFLRKLERKFRRECLWLLVFIPLYLE